MCIARVQDPPSTLSTHTGRRSTSTESQDSHPIYQGHAQPRYNSCIYHQRHPYQPLYQYRRPSHLLLHIYAISSNIFIQVKTNILRLASTDKALAHIKASVSTIDSVQGSEYDIVILLTSRPSCVDLGRCRRRGNVATSRARNLLVIIGHQDFMLSRRKSPPHPFRFWAHLITKGTLWNNDDRTAHGLLIKLKAKLQAVRRPDSDTQSSNSTTDKQHIALAALDEVSKYLDKWHRTSLFKVLLLRPKFKQNNALQLNLFVAAMRIKTDTELRQALTIISQAIDHKERNTRLCNLFKLDYRSRGPNSSYMDRIRKLYEHSKPDT